MDRDEAANLIIGAYIAKQTGYRTKEELLRETCRITNDITRMCKEDEE